MKEACYLQIDVKKAIIVGNIKAILHYASYFSRVKNDKAT